MFCREQCQGIDVCAGISCRDVHSYGDDGKLSACGAVLTADVAERHDSPTPDEVARGATDVLYWRFIGPEELDYDYVSNAWASMKLALIEYREVQFPPGPDGR